MKKFCFSIFFCLIVTNAFCANFWEEENPGQKNRYDSSISVQFGLNGMSQDWQSYGLQFLPPDLAYSRELFDNDVINISTASFYDNIGVRFNGDNYSYRVGQRVDFGFELDRYTPYATLGLGVMRCNHNYQTSPVYGVGMLYRIAKRWLIVEEMNFQHVAKGSNSNGDIVNLSVGLTYAL